MLPISLALALLPGLAPLPASPRGFTPTWVGKIILTKKNNIQIGVPGMDGNQVFVARLTYASYRVLADKGTMLKVSQDGLQGWFDKSDAVLAQDAMPYFSTLIKENPKDTRALFMRAVACLVKGEPDLAIKDYTELILIQPNDPACRSNRGLAWLLKKDYDKAIEDFTESIRLKNPVEHICYGGRGAAWAGKKEYEKALKDYDEALKLQPNYVHTLNGRGWLLATCPDKKYRDGPRAVADAQKACQLTQWTNASFIDTLAAAFAETGEFTKAVKYQKQALAIPDLKSDFVKGARERLKLFQEKKPYHRESCAPRQCPSFAGRQEDRRKVEVCFVALVFKTAELRPADL